MDFRPTTLTILLAAPTLLAQAPPAEGQQQLADELMNLLNTPVVSASKREQKAIQSPQAVESISGDYIRATGAFRIMDVLRLATSVQILDGDGRTSRVALRGVAPNASPKTIQVLVDGVPLYNPEVSPLDVESLPVPLDAIERIEIVRGPSSSLYGANAQLGVIAITTKGDKTKDGGTLRVGWGAGGTQQTQAFARASGDGLSLTAAFAGHAYPRMGAPYHVVGSSVQVTPANDYNQQVLFVKPEVHIGQDTHIWGSFARSQKLNSYEITITNTGASLYGTPYQRTRLQTAQAAWEQTWSPNLRTEFKVMEAAHLVQLGPVYAPPDSVAPTLLTALLSVDPSLGTGASLADVKTRQVSLQANWSPMKNLHVVAGADSRRITTPGSMIQGIPETTTTASGGFVSVDLEQDVLVLSLGARAENETLGGSRVSPRASVVWSLSPTMVLRAGYYTSTRSPQITEAFGSFNNLAIPTIQMQAQDLKPEKAANTEVGFRMQGSSYSLDATLFRTSLKELIANLFVTSVPRPTVQFQNSTQDLTSKGVELTVTAQPATGVLMGLNASWFSYEDPVRSAQADWAPRTLATAWCKTTQGSFFGFLALQHVAAFTAINTLGSPVREDRSAYLQVHANLGWQVTPHAAVSLYGINAARQATDAAQSSYSNNQLVRYARREAGLQLSLHF